MSRKPPALPEQIPVSYYEKREVSGYSYRRVIGSYLKRVRGKKRRVRYYVHRTVTVPAREVLIWTVVLPPPVAATKKPKRKAAPKPPSADKWYNVADYQRALLAQKEMDGSEVEEIENEIMHSDPDGDSINAAHLFVWYKRELPKNIRGPKGKRPFRMFRIWFLVYHKNHETYRLWCRSSLVDESTYSECHALSIELHRQVIGDLENKFSYIEVRELCAWTAYRLNEKASRRDRRAINKKLGGAE